MTLLPWLRAWADLLDARFRIPGTSIRFGIDPILSLIPGVGDLASPIYAVALVAQGVYQGVPKVVLLRMVLNALVDACIGVVPVAGTIADIFWRANLRNLALLEQYARPGVRPTRADYVFVSVVAVVFGLIVLIPVMLAMWLALSLVLWLSGR